MTVSQLDEWLYGNLKEAFPKASDMELADLRIPRTCPCCPLEDRRLLWSPFVAGFIMSTSEWKDPRDLSTLPAFIQKRTLYLGSRPCSWLTFPFCDRATAASEEHQEGGNTVNHHPVPLRHAMRRRRQESEIAKTTRRDRKGMSTPQLPFTLIMADHRHPFPSTALCETLQGLGTD